MKAAKIWRRIWTRGAKTRQAGASNEKIKWGGTTNVAVEEGVPIGRQTAIEKIQISNSQFESQRRHALASLFRRAETNQTNHEVSLLHVCLLSVCFVVFSCWSSVVLFCFALLFPSSTITTSLCPTELNIAATLWLPLPLHASTLSAFCGFAVHSFSFPPCQT